MSGLLSPSDCVEPPSHITHRDSDHFMTCFSILNRYRQEELVSILCRLLKCRVLKPYKAALINASHKNQKRKRVNTSSAVLAIFIVCTYIMNTKKYQHYAVTSIDFFSFRKGFRASTPRENLILELFSPYIICSL